MVARRKSRYVFMTDEKPHRFRKFLITLLLLIAFLFVLLLLLNIGWGNQVELKTVRVTVQGLPDEIENWSILHISDLHGQELGSKQSAIATALGSNRYSCVVITGDVTGTDGDVSAMLDLLALIPADVPVLLCPGDEDPPLVATQAHASLSVWNDWAQTLEDAGVTLVDEPVCVTRGKSRLWFIPEYLLSLDLDSLETAYSTQLAQLRGEGVQLTADTSAQKRAAEYQLEKIERIRAVRKDITDTDVVVVLSHTPLSADYLYQMINWQSKDDLFSLRNADLVLAGHYCGGGWRIPFGPAIYVPGLGFFPEDEQVVGLSQRYGITQYISPGLGTSAIYGLMKGRVMNRPAITLIYLTAKYV